MTIWTLFEVILASDSEKKPEKDRSRKTCFLENVEMLVRGAITTSERSGDVRPRRPDGAILKGNQRRGSKKHDI